MGVGGLCMCECARRVDSSSGGEFALMKSGSFGEGEGLTSLSETTPMRRPMLVT